MTAFTAGLIKEQARIAVTAGVALLDEKIPDWPQRVNPRTLDLRKASRCVVGQAVQGPRFYRNKLARLGIHLNGEHVRDDARYGFYLGYGYDTPEAQDAGWAALQAEWLRVITERRAAA